MGCVPVRSSMHKVDGQYIEFSVLAPTNEDHTTREVSVTDIHGNTAELRFEHDDFQLFKSILNEY